MTRASALLMGLAIRARLGPVRLGSLSIVKLSKMLSKKIAGIISKRQDNLPANEQFYARDWIFTS